MGLSHLIKTSGSPSIVHGWVDAADIAGAASAAIAKGSTVKVNAGAKTYTGGGLFNKLFKSITVDNDCEFQDFEGIEMAHRRKGKRTIVFFCHPYSAYERGSNENMNRLIRRFFPKGTSFDNVTEEQVAEAERWVNNYPRKLLGWKSAAMLFEEELQAA